MTYVFTVNDMNCGHCVKRIETALGQSGKATDVKIDLASKTVRVESSAPAAEISALIEDAGYTPVLA